MPSHCNNMVCTATPAPFAATVIDTQSGYNACTRTYTDALLVYNVPIYIMDKEPRVFSASIHVVYTTLCARSRPSPVPFAVAGVMRRRARSQGWIFRPVGGQRAPVNRDGHWAYGRRPRPGGLFIKCDAERRRPNSLSTNDRRPTATAWPTAREPGDLCGARNLSLSLSTRSRVHPAHAARYAFPLPPPRYAGVTHRRDLKSQIYSF